MPKVPMRVPKVPRLESLRRILLKVKTTMTKVKMTNMVQKLP